MHPIVKSGVARTASFVPQAIASLLTSRIVISHFGIPAFDAYTLSASLILLVPLNNLGVGAAVTSAVAAHGSSHESVHRVTLTAARTVAGSALFLAIVSVFVTIAGWWHAFLGPAAGDGAFYGIAMVVYAITFVPALSQSMLLGVHRFHLSIVVQTFLAPVALLLVGAIVGAKMDERYLIVVPAVALAVVNMANAIVAGRVVKFSWGRVLRELPFPDRYAGASIRAMSGPMLIVSLSTPIQLQSDRIVLSHFATKQAVANYAVAIQIFAPVAALIAAAAQPLWPIYTAARARGGHGPNVAKIMLVFGLACSAVSAVLVLVANPIGHLIGGHQIHLGWTLPIVAAVAIALQAATYPMAMSLMDPVGLRLVALSAAIAAPLNVAVSIFFARWYGAPGPLLASCIVCTVIQIIPVGWYANRRQHDAVRGIGRHRVERQKMIEAGLLPAGPVAGEDAPADPAPAARAARGAQSPALSGADAQARVSADYGTEGFGMATSVADGVPAVEPIEVDEPPANFRTVPVPYQRGFVPRP
jgi:O-antigen/teichoic acid export membrane protein